MILTLANEFALEAARKYLQSIVFVDDEIYQPVLASDLPLEVPIAAEMHVFAKPIEPVEKTDQNQSPEVSDASFEPQDGGHFHPKQLVESFAREGMVCALYEPKPDFSTAPESEIFKLCERADVVILDWEFYKTPGAKVLELLGGLVTEAQTEVPHHIRLCAIYTTTQNLQHIASEICDYLLKLDLKVSIDGKYNLSAGSTRIIVLGKPSVGRPDEQAKAAEVEEDKLAQRIIEEFASMHQGILPSMALQGLASIRTNTKKILDKFHRDMDGAFLIHRGLILPDDDAFEQIPELLVEEALAVVVDNTIGVERATDIAVQAIDKIGIKTAWANKNGVLREAGKDAIELLKSGPRKVQARVNLDHLALDTLHAELDAAGSNAKERLAALYACRTQYGNDRSLAFGTIVRFDHQVGDQDIQKRYAICLMPLCDSVRLKKDANYQFPFWTLRADNSGASSKGIVVELPEQEGFIELFSMGKPRDQLWLESFKAGNTKKVIAERRGTSFVFEGNAKEIEWVGQLKPSHAQRIAHEIAGTFSRVGVLEAEWLRLKSDRPKCC